MAQRIRFNNGHELECLGVHSNQESYSGIVRDCYTFLFDPTKVSLADIEREFTEANTTKIVIVVDEPTTEMVEQVVRYDKVLKNKPQPMMMPEEDAIEEEEVATEEQSDETVVEEAIVEEDATEAVAEEAVEDMAAEEITGLGQPVPEEELEYEMVPVTEMVPVEKFRQAEYVHENYTIRVAYGHGFQDAILNNMGISAPIKEDSNVVNWIKMLQTTLDERKLVETEMALEALILDSLEREVAE